MGYYVSNLIGIRLGGVFSGKTDMNDLKKRIASIVLEMRKGESPPDLGDASGDVSHCLSSELSAHKGTYVVIAGVFNYWTFIPVSLFAKRLSEEFGTDVMLMSWDEEQDTVQCQIFTNGHAGFDVQENPIGQIMRRIAG